MSFVAEDLADKRVVEALQDGLVGVLPTDTVYGVVCRAADQSAVKKLYELKSRDKKPGTIIASSTEQLVNLGLKARYLKPVEHYWPNPISIIIPSTFELPHLHQGVGSLAVRVVNDNKLTDLLSVTGPLLTSSANLPGEPEAKNIDEAQVYFGDTIGFYVDGGDLSNRSPSTVIRVVDDAVEVLRQGAVKINEAGEIEQ
jgi:L-threonylcarbamoyladenylate synthase